MTTPSDLRQLARDYFEGRLERGDYRQRRKLMIDAWVAGGNSSEASATAQIADDGAAHVSVHEQPDGDALENAFANRNRQAGLAEPEQSPPSLIPDFSQLPRDVAPGANERAATMLQTTDQSRSDRSGRYLLWLLPVLVLSAALAVLLFISW